MARVLSNAEILLTAFIRGDIDSLPALVDELEDDNLFVIYQNAMQVHASAWQIDLLIERILYLIGLQPAPEFKLWKIRIIQMVRRRSEAEYAQSKLDRLCGELHEAGLSIDDLFSGRLCD